MQTSIREPQPVVARPHMDAVHAGIEDSAWRPLYRAAGVAALLSVSFTFLAVIIFIASPPPTTITAWFTLFQRNGLLGLMNLDLLMLVTYVLMGVIYVALYGALHRGHEPVMALAALCGLVSIVTYIASNTGFNLLVLSGQYAAATTEAQRAAIRAAGQAMLAIWQGTAYDVSYVLGGIAALLVAAVMLRSHRFGRVTAYVGLVLGVLMLVPGTVGTIGLYISLISLVPTVIWLALLASQFFQFASSQQHDTAAHTLGHDASERSSMISQTSATTKRISVAPGCAHNKAAPCGAKRK